GNLHGRDSEQGRALGLVRDPAAELPVHDAADRRSGSALRQGRVLRHARVRRLEVAPDDGVSRRLRGERADAAGKGARVHVLRHLVVRWRHLLIVLALAACGNSDAPPERPPPQTIRRAVIGGMIETGLWPELVARYERLTGNKVELAVSGPKPQIVDAFRKGGIDLITVHASDAMVNLVADGLAVDPQPWARNDLVIVGPGDDPAHVRGERDAIAALRKIFAAKAPLLVH